MHFADAPKYIFLIGTVTLSKKKGSVPILLQMPASICHLEIELFICQYYHRALSVYFVLTSVEILPPLSDYEHLENAIYI